MFLEDLRGAPDYPERVADLAAGWNSANWILLNTLLWTLNTGH